MILVSVVLPRLAPPAQQSVSIAVTQLSSFDRSSVVQQTKNQRVQAAHMAQVQSWSKELKQGLAEYQAKQVAEAAAQAQAAQIAARSNHPAPPPEIAMDITDAFSPLGPAAVQWAINVAYCESRYHPISRSRPGATTRRRRPRSPWTSLTRSVPSGPPRCSGRSTSPTASRGTTRTPDRGPEQPPGAAARDRHGHH